MTAVWPSVPRLITMTDILLCVHLLGLSRYQSCNIDVCLIVDTCGVCIVGLNQMKARLTVRITAISIIEINVPVIDGLGWAYLQLYINILFTFSIDKIRELIDSDGSCVVGICATLRIDVVIKLNYV